MSAGPPPLPGTSGSNTTIKNVVIGILTTVTASAIIYFLGFGGDHSDTKEIKIKKEATTEAWNSLMFYENQFRETGTRMVCQGDTAQMEANILNEYDKIIKNISNIEKVEHVDNRLISLIDRRIATLSGKRKASADYYTALETLGNVSEDDPRSKDLYHNFISKINILETQDSSFIEGVSKELNKKYSSKFELPGPFIVRPEVLYGNWTVDRNKYLDLKKDNTFSFIMESINYPGKWSLNDLNMQLHFDDGSSIVYTINSGSQSFMMTTDNTGNVHFFCR